MRARVCAQPKPGDGAIRQARGRRRGPGVGIADVYGDLHVCATTSTGGVWHAIRYQNATWSAFANVLGQTGSPGSMVVDVDCAGIGADLHIAMTTASGGVWHSSRHAGTNSWNSLGNVEVAAGDIVGAFNLSVTSFAGEPRLDCHRQRREGAQQLQRHLVLDHHQRHLECRLERSSHLDRCQHRVGLLTSARERHGRRCVHRAAVTCWRGSPGT
jgi:hypothetical protein